MLSDLDVGDFLYLLSTLLGILLALVLLRKYSIRLSWKLALFPIPVSVPVLFLCADAILDAHLTTFSANIFFALVPVLLLLPVRSLSLRDKGVLALFYGAMAPIYGFASMLAYAFLVVIFRGDLCG